VGGRIDLELRIRDDAGDLKTVWIEAKLFGRFQRRPAWWFTDGWVTGAL
jgi:hypothetical protein